MVPLTGWACDVTAVCPYLPIPKEAFFFCRVANFDQHEYWLMVAHKVATVGWHTGWQLLVGTQGGDCSLARQELEDGGEEEERLISTHEDLTRLIKRRERESTGQLTVVAFDVRDPRFADQHEYWLMVAHKVATVDNAQGIVDSSGAKVPKGDAVIMGYFLEHPSGSTHRRRYRIEEMEVTMDVRLMFHLDIGEELKELSNGVFEVPKTTDTMLQGLLGLV